MWAAINFLWRNQFLFIFWQRGVDHFTSARKCINLYVFYIVENHFFVDFLRLSPVADKKGNFLGKISSSLSWLQKRKKNMKSCLIWKVNILSLLSLERLEIIFPSSGGVWVVYHYRWQLPLIYDRTFNLRSVRFALSWGSFQCFTCICFVISNGFLVCHHHCHKSTFG